MKGAITKIELTNIVLATELLQKLTGRQKVDSYSFDFSRKDQSRTWRSRRARNRFVQLTWRWNRSQ